MAVNLLVDNLLACDLLRFLCTEAGICVDSDTGRLSVKSATWNIQDGLKIVGTDDKIYSIILRPIVKDVADGCWREANHNVSNKLI